MPNEDFPIAGSFNEYKIKSLDSERSVNWYPYYDEKIKKKWALLPTSGLERQLTFPSASSAGSRQSFVFQGVGETENHLYTIFGRDVYRVDANYNYILIFSFTSSSAIGFVGISANTHQILFVDGNEGWVWDTQTSIATKIADPNFPTNPIDTTMCDGFIWVAQGGTNIFRLSMLNQALIWGPYATTVTASSANNYITVPTGTNIFQTNVPVMLTSSADLPAPLSADTTYFVINNEANTPGTIQLADSPNNAIARIPIILTTDGTGTITLKTTGEVQEGQISSQPGNIVACRTLHRRIFLFSKNFIEVWENQGIGSNLPFRRNNSLLIEYGTPAIGSIAVGFGSLFFLSQDEGGLGSVMEISGSQAIAVSTPALDERFEEYAGLNQVSDARAFLIKESSLIFYRLNFTAANHTYIYNHSLSSQQQRLWHEEEVLNGDRHLGQTQAFFNGRNLMGDYKRPILYHVNADLNTNDGQQIKRMRIVRPVVTENYKRIRIDRVQIDFLQGEKNNPLRPPIVYLSISKDSGNSFGYMLDQPLGDVGQRTVRTIWRSFGTVPRGQSFVIKIECYDNYPYAILGASWSYEILPE